MAQKVIKEADVVVVVFDVRMPEMSKNPEILGLIKNLGKRCIKVFNKIDLVSDEKLRRMKEENKNDFFVSGIHNKGISELRRKLNIIRKEIKLDTIKVGIVGYPNVGKSAIINALARRARTAISPVAGTTKGIQFVKVGKLKILDSPGVIPLRDRESKLGFIGAKNPENLKNPEKVAADIIFHVLSANKSALEDYAGVRLDNSDAYEIMEIIGKKKGMLSKGGKTDERRVAMQIIRDWNKGKLRV